MKKSALIVYAMMATAPTLADNVTTKSHLSAKGQRIEAQKKAAREAEYYKPGGMDKACADMMGQILMNPRNNT